MIPSKKYRVLVVEDNRVNQLLIMKILQKLGFNPTLAENGQEALDRVLHDGPFDIVFMDLKMPVMDGLEATNEIRKAGFTDLPVIALTASAFETDHQKCMDAGMVDFMTKPIKSINIKLMIHKWAQSIVSTTS